MVLNNNPQTSSIFLFKKIAPLQLILYPCKGGGVHVAATCFGTADAEMGPGKHPSVSSRALFSNCSRGIEGFPSLRLFRRFHNVQATDENNFGSLFSEQTTNIISKKLVLCLMVLWLHKGMFC